MINIWIVLEWLGLVVTVGLVVTAVRVHSKHRGEHGIWSRLCILSLCLWSWYGCAFAIKNERYYALYRCDYHLRQLGVALRDYASRHSGRLPVASNWMDALESDGFEIPRCFTAGDGFGYGFNVECSGKKLSELDPDHQLLVAECADTSRNAVLRMDSDLMGRHIRSEAVPIILVGGRQSNGGNPGTLWAPERPLKPDLFAYVDESRRAVLEWTVQFAVWVIMSVPLCAVAFLVPMIRSPKGSPGRKFWRWAILACLATLILAFLTTPMAMP